MIASRSSSRVAQRWRSRTFFCNSEKNDSIAALSAHAPTRPIDPDSLWSRSVRTKACERNCDPLSEWMISVPSGERRAIADRNAVHRELGGHPVAHRVADDPGRARVLDRAQVELPLTGRVFGDVGEPQLVETHRGEVAFDEIVVHRRAGLRDRPRFFVNAAQIRSCEHNRATRFSPAFTPWRASSSAMNR